MEWLVLTTKSGKNQEGIFQVFLNEISERTLIKNFSFLILQYKMVSVQVKYFIQADSNILLDKQSLFVLFFFFF